MAKKLIGNYLVRDVGKNKLIGKIVETEAYMGTKDKASHTYNGKKTKRTEILYSRGGLAYVYTIYGIYNCFNIVANNEDKPEAVFIRALEPVEGIEMMYKNRNTKNLEQIELTNGPSKMCQAMVIDKSFYGHDLTSGKDLYLVLNKCNNKVKNSARINIDYAEEDKNNSWRFYQDDNPYVSKV